MSSSFLVAFDERTQASSRPLVRIVRIRRRQSTRNAKRILLTEPLFCIASRFVFFFFFFANDRRFQNFALRKRNTNGT